ncbi:metallophosphoesterase [Methylorubrum populi BJ001]|uniref:Metallophosphoesterase n=1 Tax=Methylorubrum populi (strain ATCC BAA-705 / NCIMB 13946 / BJ001) TaxID=441620 RepID=B1ZCD1_METPB|nr:metallophosphoesterase [Methylorubrum populi BJ001]
MAAANSITVAAGSPVVTGTLTSFVAAEFDLFMLDGMAVAIASRDSSTQLTLKQPWPGESRAGAVEWVIANTGPYWQSSVATNRQLAALLSKFEAGPVKWDASGPRPGRDAYNDQPVDFVYLSVDPLPFTLFVKRANTNSAADWSAGQPLQLKADSTAEAEAARDLAQQAAGTAAGAAGTASAAASFADLRASTADAAAGTAQGAASTAASAASTATGAAASAAQIAPNRTYAELVADTSPAVGTIRQVATPPNAGIYELRLVNGSKTWAYLAPSVPSIDSQMSVLSLAGVGEQLGLPTLPVMGLAAAPNVNSAVLPFVRNSGASRIDERQRIDYVGANEVPHEYDRDTGAYLGWRIDPASENIARYSEDFTNAAWTKARVTASLEANPQSPANSPNPTRLTETTDNGVHGVTQTFAVNQGEFTTCSIFYFPGERTRAFVQIDTGMPTENAIIDLLAATVVQVSGTTIKVFVERVRTSWIRVTVSFIPPSTGTMRFVAALAADGTGAQATAYPGDPTKGLWIWGAQIEKQPISTSYIPALANTPGVRAAAAIKSAPLRFRDVGALFVRFRVSRLQAVGAGGRRVVSVYVNESNRLHVTVDQTGLVYLGCVFSGQTVVVNSVPVPLNTDVTVAASWEPGRQAIAVNGTLYVASAPSSNELIGFPVMAIGSRTGEGTDAFMGTVHTALLLPRPLSNAQMIALSSGASAASGGGSGNAATLHRVEVASDPSRDMTLTWHAPNTAPKAAEYRVLGSTSWMSAGAVAKDLPASTDRVFFATVTNLTPETIYEWRAAGSGAAAIRRFRTLPNYRARSLRVAVVSDWQRDSANALYGLSHFNVLSGLVAARNADLILMGGDHFADDGNTSAALTQRCRDYIGAWSSRFVDADGCLIPIAAIAGNHEASDTTGGNPAGGAYNGQGVYGYMDKIFSTFYRRGAANTSARGYGWFEVGTELLVVALETNHATPLAEQVPWLRDLLAARASRYRHIIVMGHIGPSGLTNADWSSTAPRLMREQILPIVQQYPQAIFVHGHVHNLMATRRVRFVENPAGGVNAWTERADGIRCLGAGGWDSPDWLPFDAQDQASDTTLGDGSKLIEYLVASNQAPRGVTPISAPANNSFDPATKHFWEIDLNETAQNAKAISLNNTVLINLTEPVAS